MGLVPLQAPPGLDTDPRMASSAHTLPRLQTCAHAPSLPDWLFLFLALCSESSPSIPTVSQLLGRLGE